jgi:hypothetical protein
MEVMRLIVDVQHRPQLGRTGPNHGVDARHLHLLTIDFPAV